MGGGNHQEVARAAGDNPLASEIEAAEENSKGTAIAVTVIKHNKKQEAPAKEAEISAEKDVGKDHMDLTAIAAAAQAYEAQRAVIPGNDTIKVEISAPEDPMEDVKPTVPSIPSLKALLVDASIAQSLDHSIKHELVASPTEEQLPPILQHSPNSALPNGNNPNSIKLPSISESIGDINNLPEPTSAGDSPYAQSPPGRPHPRFSAMPGHTHGSPPKSPIDTFPRRELPSPGGRGSFYYNAHRRASQTDGPQYTSAADYSSSNTETPSTDQSGSTPATIAIDRMSIDGITNPQIGGFQCTFAGCNAPPFQTQVSICDLVRQPILISYSIS